MNNLEYKRLEELNSKISKGLANDAEKKEYVKILKDNGKITNDQYNKYNESQNSDDLLKFILIVGGFALLAYLLSKNNE